MKVSCIDFAATGKFSAIFNDYVAGKPSLKPFYGHFPNIANFELQIGQKQGFGPAQREVLYKALSRQYEAVPAPPQLALDLLLQPNTFTVTTGHQLNIFTGPLYFHYKIMTVINAAKMLRQHYPAYNFVPVYWMASEDHDADEISSFSLFGKNYTWNHGQQGAVGRFAPQSLREVVAQTPEMDGLLARAYAESPTLAHATRLIVNELYATDGLVVVDGDDAALKRTLAPVMLDELFRQSAYARVNEASQALEAAGYAGQVYPRPINLFYLAEGLRERIVAETDAAGQARFHVLNTELRFSPAEIEELLAQHPERFSPNVVLRPLYQEMILPNLAYTGGPGELAYWLQLKSMFEHFEVPFPILLPRNCALVIDAPQQQKMAKLGLQVPDLFLPQAQLKERLVQAAEGGQAPTLAQETDELKAVFARASGKLAQADASLAGLAGAEQQRALKSMEMLEKRLQKAVEQRSATELGQLAKLLEQLFPKGGLQERSDNFLSFYLNNRLFLRQVMATLDPFNLAFYVLESE